MSRDSLLNKAKRFWKKSVSLEPVIVIYIFSNYILTGSQITTNLLIYKTCNLTDFSNSSITEEIDCTNLTWITTSNETTVMQDVNDFQVRKKLFFSDAKRKFIVRSDICQIKSIKTFIIVDGATMATIWTCPFLRLVRRRFS